MEHIVILRKKGQLLDKILSGEKTIESRWYVNRRDPWNKITVGDLLYFKESGEPITARARVSQVLQFSDLDYTMILTLLTQYGSEIGLAKSEFHLFALKHMKKKYGILVFLDTATSVVPFSINKTGFGLMSAWLCVDTIVPLMK